MATTGLPLPPDPLSGHPGYVLRRASSAAIASLNERLEPLELRHTDVALLMLIDACRGITQSDAGRILDIQRANMVPFVGRLRRRGLIVRRRVDGRSNALTLSEEGATLLRGARAVVNAHDAALLQRVPRHLRSVVLPVLMALWRDGTH